MTTPAHRRHMRRTALHAPNYLLTALSAGGVFLGVFGLIAVPMGMLTLLSPATSSSPVSPDLLGLIFLIAGLGCLLIGALSLVSFVYNAVRLRRIAAESHEAYIRDVTST